MTYNLFLAVLPVIFSLFLFKMPNKFFTAIVAGLWFFYLPNTVYVITDIYHLLVQWHQVWGMDKLFLLVQYTLLEIIGLLCFLIAFYPFEKIFQFSFFRKQKLLWLMSVNFLMGYALVIGKFERVNSWDVLLNPMLVMTSTIQIFTSFEMIGLILLFGLFSNFFYFLFREKTKLLFLRWLG